MRQVQSDSTAGRNRELAQIGVRLIDDCCMAWFAAAKESERVLGAWLQDGDAEAYFVYRAALDREEAAARDLERLTTLAGPCEDTLSLG